VGLIVLAVAVPVILLASLMVKFGMERKWEGWSRTKLVFCGSLRMEWLQRPGFQGLQLQSRPQNTIWEGFM
jgi:hypothetical protein